MNETDYKSLSIDELVKQISPSSPVIEELTKRGVIRNRNYTGNIGEYFASDFFNNFNFEIYTKTKDLPKQKYILNLGIDALSPELKASILFEKISKSVSHRRPSVCVLASIFHESGQLVKCRP